jgi:RHS repeat-associated protein
VLSETNPAFQIPTGYAGGIYDNVTKLTRFGFRDYDASAGRWTARDPILFEGGQGNLYIYAGNAPLLNKDPNGLWIGSFGVNLTGAILGGGFQFKAGF